MKKVMPLFTVLLLVLTMIMCSFGVCAEKYKSAVVSDDFTNASKTLFLRPGDMNADKVIDAKDLPILVNILLCAESSDYSVVCSSDLFGKLYSDTNGDNYVNILDLVKAKRNAAKTSDFVSGGVLNVDGKSVYSGSINSDFLSGVTYTVTYKYKTQTSLRVKINIQGDEEERTCSPTDSWQTVSYDVNIPQTKVSVSGFEAQIIGIGEVDNFSIVRKGSMDNELSAS